MSSSPERSTIRMEILVLRMYSTSTLLYMYSNWYIIVLMIIYLSLVALPR